MEASYLSQTQTHNTSYSCCSPSYKSSSLIVAGVIAGLIGSYFILVSYKVIQPGLNAISSLDVMQCRQIGYALISTGVLMLALGMYKKFIARDTAKDYSFKELKKISDKLITGIYCRTLVSKSYKIQTTLGKYDDVAMTHFPDTPEKIKEYEEKVPAIVEEARNAVEAKLHKRVPISNLLNEIDTHHADLFPFVY